MSTKEQEKDRLQADHDAIQRLLNNDLPGVGKENDEEYATQLLDRLRELGVIQVSNERQRVFFHTIHNARPLVMFQMEAEILPQFERMLPIHVYETVNCLMWERILEPKLALAYKGLFDWMHVREFGFVLSHILSDSAFDHLHDMVCSSGQHRKKS